VLLHGRAGADDVNFRNDVMAVLSKAGCNSRACHGNANGKAGFRLSLRGEDPAFDFMSLTRDTFGRRIDRTQPAESLILRKATGSVPHEGGRRFAIDSTEYAILSRWIESGARVDRDDAPRVTRLEVTPADQVLVEPAGAVALRVMATFSDGDARDVTRLACYEPASQVVSVGADGTVQRQQLGETSVLVRYLNAQVTARLAFVPARPGFEWRDVPEVNFIDTHVFVKLRTLRAQPSEVCSDSVLLRRAFLDAIGVLPTADETRRFLADVRPDKRTRLIDELLARPEFADFWALKWSDLLRSEEKTLDRKGVQALHRWVRQSIADGKPLNEFARELVAARGSTYSNPAANYYRANRSPQVRAETTAQVFLGLRLGCAKCHNHPFDQWTMNDYYSLSSFFARVQYKIVDNDRKDRLDQHEFDGEQIVWMDREGEVENPRTGEPATARILGGDFASRMEIGADRDRLEQLADWIARSDNPFFARTQVNRIWFHLLGRGIVEPIDDFRASNPPVNPALLDALAADFVAHGFDLRHAVRTIMQSRTYQLSATPNDTNRDDEINFSRAIVRPLKAEVLLDAYTQVTGVPVKFNGYPLGLRAGSLPGVRTTRRRESPPTPAEDFLKTFGKPERLLACECERSADTTLGQAFQLISGELANEMLTDTTNRISQFLAESKTDRAVIDDFYHSALSRSPSDAELAAAADFIAKSPSRRAAMEDLLWGLLNSKEFLLRR